MAIDTDRMKASGEGDWGQALACARGRDRRQVLGEAGALLFLAGVAVWILKAAPPEPGYRLFAASLVVFGAASLAGAFRARTGRKDLAAPGDVLAELRTRTARELGALESVWKEAAGCVIVGAWAPWMVLRNLEVYRAEPWRLSLATAGLALFALLYSAWKRRRIETLRRRLEALEV